LRNLDLSGKGAMDVRNWQKDDIALPMSPILQPSSLELSDSSLYTSDDSLPLANSWLKRPIRNPLLAPKFPQPPRRERTPLVCSPSAMNATHMSSEAVFPKDVPLVQGIGYTDIPCCVGRQLPPPAVKGSSSLYMAVPTRRRWGWWCCDVVKDIF
jgi:hypothetical protein